MTKMLKKIHPIIVFVTLCILFFFLSIATHCIKREIHSLSLLQKKSLIWFADNLAMQWDR